MTSECVCKHWLEHKSVCLTIVLLTTMASASTHSSATPAHPSFEDELLDIVNDLGIHLSTMFAAANTGTLQVSCHNDVADCIIGSDADYILPVPYRTCQPMDQVLVNWPMSDHACQSVDDSDNDLEKQHGVDNGLDKQYPLEDAIIEPPPPPPPPHAPPPPGVKPVILPDGHVVELLQTKPSSINWGLGVEEHNNALYIKYIKEDGHWHSMLGSKYSGWYIHSVHAKEDPKEMKAVLKADIPHLLRVQLGPPVRAPPPDNVKHP